MKSPMTEEGAGRRVQGGRLREQEVRRRKRRAGRGGGKME